MNFANLKSKSTVKIVKTTFKRERPYVRTCGTELPANIVDCDSNDRLRSFFSGHAAATFALAAVTCSHHLHIDVYGSGLISGLVCASGLVLASVTGTLRIVGDRHFATDVLAGAAVGTGIGFLIPWLFHYRNRKSSTVDAPSDVSILPTANGLQAVLKF